MIDSAAMLATLTSHAQAVGGFERVIGHEPKNAPGQGLTAAYWVAGIEPIQNSGLNKTSVRVEIIGRIYTPMLQEPEDAIDVSMLNAVDVLLTAYSGDFTMGGTARQIDLLGQFGPALGARAGYVNADNRLLRIMDITIPIIVDDIWAQSP